HAVRALLVAGCLGPGPVGHPCGPPAGGGARPPNTAMELSASAAEVAAEARRSYASTTAVLTDAIRRAQREGDVAARLDPEMTARAVLAGQLGLIMLGRVDPNPTALSTVAEALLDGLLPAA
ncbi:TetR family transcriptional regulator C-terminal domain-containing protein, partial [Nocardia brasiliensis]|uniref:TetR family transcriptional regulator C-terminal domain-containing protein n=1 Tax=Nocardia brasiliensis TaxID=37326 RepID=UPI003D794C33